MARGVPGLVCFPRRRSFARGGAETARLPRAVFSLAFAVCAAAPSRLAWDDLFGLAWGAPEDGGPLWWKTCLSVHQARANKALAPLGVRLSGRRGGGFLGGLAAVDLDRARGASERGDAMGDVSAVAPGLRPAKRAAQNRSVHPLTHSGLARHSAHEGSPCKRLAGAAVLATGRAVPAFFQVVSSPFHAAIQAEGPAPCRR